MPLLEDELLFEFKQAKRYALGEFRKRAMGDDFEQFLNELKKSF